MTNSDNRLDRIEAISESNTKNIDILVGIVTAHQERLGSMESRMTTLLEEIRDIKTEIRGLQTENHRILNHLLGQTNGQ
jgi:uncharacterized coiled-coil protein SlyX